MDMQQFLAEFGHRANAPNRCTVALAAASVASLTSIAIEQEKLTHLSEAEAVT